MNEQLCRYAVARFLPYPDGGEFVNVGVLLCCEQTGFLGFRLETKKRKRITDFFPELDPKILRDGTAAWREELTRLHFEAQPATAAALFAEAVMPKATAWRFGTAGALLSPDPQEALEMLFNRYVLRQYETPRETPEHRLRRRLSDVLRQNQLLALYPEKRVGGEDYGVTLPFVHWPPEAELPLKAIKPLYLNRNTPNEVFEYADDWLARVKRLRRRDAWPLQSLFAVQPPTPGAKSYNAYVEVVEEMRALDIEVRPLADNPAILRFAREGLGNEINFLQHTR